jgi:hypothetical protein
MQEYKEHVKEMKSLGLPTISFWDWYSSWCFEEGLFNDRMSYQNEISEFEAV